MTDLSATVFELEQQVEQLQEELQQQRQAPAKDVAAGPDEAVILAGRVTALLNGIDASGLSRADRKHIRRMVVRAMVDPDESDIRPVLPGRIQAAAVGLAEHAAFGEGATAVEGGLAERELDEPAAVAQEEVVAHPEVAQLRGTSSASRDAPQRGVPTAPWNVGMIARGLPPVRWKLWEHFAKLTVAEEEQFPPLAAQFPPLAAPAPTTETDAQTRPTPAVQGGSAGQNWADVVRYHLAGTSANEASLTIEGLRDLWRPGWRRDEEAEEKPPHRDEDHSSRRLRRCRRSSSSRRR